MREDNNPQDPYSWDPVTPPPPPPPPTSSGPTDWIPDGQGSWMPPQSSWPAGQHWDPHMANFVADETQAPGPPIDPGPGPAPGPGATPTGGGLIAPFTGSFAPYQPQPVPSMASAYSTIPGAPTFPSIPKFVAPSMEEAMNDPGYKFTLQQGDNNLTNWSAARGTLNDSSTGKAFIDYGQAAATTQYGNVWDRAAQTYDRNTATQFLDPFAAAAQTWQQGTVQPTLANFGAQATATQNNNNQGFQQNWNQWLQDWNIFRDQRDSTFNKQLSVATA